MLSTLRVGEVGAVVLMHGQAQSTFKASDMVFEEVWVFVKVNILKSKSS
jgi:hypothetical protein